MTEKRHLPIRLQPAVRCLVSIFAALALSSCDDVSPRRGGGGYVSVTEEVSRLLKENESFEFDFDLQDVNGQRLSKADFAGKVLIVDIWGTWCPPCRTEVPLFQALQLKYGEQGLQVVGMNDERTDDDANAARLVRSFCRTQGVDYPCALITQQIKEQVPEFGGFPTTLFIDHTGKVRLKLVGAYDMPVLKTIVESLLKEIPPGKDASADDEPKPEDDGKPAE
jgi:thiol-disulfide isomerase/thioredoxin